MTGVLASPRPPDTRLQMTERQLHAAVTDLCKMLALPVYHTYDSRRSAHGWPDVAICGTRLILRELKTARGRVTAAQERWGHALVLAGTDWDVWRPADLRSGRITRELNDIRQVT